MEPWTAIFLILALWNQFDEPEPLCDFTEEVVIRRDERRVKGELTTTYKCNDVLIVERLGSESR
jgi:hypothetical protein